MSNIEDGKIYTCECVIITDFDAISLYPTIVMNRFADVNESKLYTCECGVIGTRSNKARHLKTRRHRKLLRLKIDEMYEQEITRFNTDSDYKVRTFSDDVMDTMLRTQMHRELEFRIKHNLSFEELSPIRPKYLYETFTKYDDDVLRFYFDHYGKCPCHIKYYAEGEGISLIAINYLFSLPIQSNNYFVIADLVLTHRSKTRDILFDSEDLFCQDVASIIGEYV